MNTITLDKLPLNSYGKIVSLNCVGPIHRRLLDLGLVKDTCIIPVFKSPSNGIRAFSIRGSLIAIRDEDCNLISIYTKNS